MPTIEEDTTPDVAIIFEEKLREEVCVQCGKVIVLADDEHCDLCQDCWEKEESINYYNVRHWTADGDYECAILARDEYCCYGF